jgi:hypothetical protein
MVTVIDRSLNVPGLSPVCTFCRHEVSFRKCAAFPDAIPLPIWRGEDTHERPYPGDHGIQFSPVPGGKVTRPQAPAKSA